MIANIIRICGIIAFILCIVSTVVMASSKCIKNRKVSDRLFVSSFYVSILSAFAAIILCVVLSFIKLGEVFI